MFLWTQYQFPIQSIIEAPFVNFLPRDGFGSRFISYLTGFVSVVSLLVVFIRLAPVKKCWPGTILVLFPSAYLLMIQFGYPMLGYTSAIVLWSLALLLSSCLPSKDSKWVWLVVVVMGFLCGLSFTNNMLSLSVILPIAIVVCSGRNLKNMAIRSLNFGVGCLVGLTPYIVGALRYPGARDAVSGVRCIKNAISRLWEPTLSFSLPRTLGVDPTVFPDSHITLGHPQWLVSIAGFVYLVLLLSVTIESIQKVIRASKNRHWLCFASREIFVGISWLGIIMFAFSGRANAHSFCYLASVAWVFPFIVYFAFDGFSKSRRIIVGSLAIIIAGFNIATSICLAQTWTTPDYARDAVHAPDLQPAIDFLHKEGISHCVASYWAAYRIDFLTDERILCSQPMNERFPGWPIPYKEKVDAETNVAYVLTEHIKYMKPKIFERHMKTMDVEAEHTTKGEFEIYYDFENESPPRGERIKALDINLKASDNLHNTDKMLDGDHQTFWRSKSMQEAGMWVEINLDKPMVLDRLLIYRGIYANDYPSDLVIERPTSEGWKEIPFDTYNEWGDKFQFKNDHPIYGLPTVKTYLFNSPQVSTLRLRISEPRKCWAWTITELELWGRMD